MLASPEKPYATRTRLPPFCLLIFLTEAWIQATNPDIDDNLVARGELLLLLALDVQVGRIYPTTTQIQLFFDTVPNVGV